MAIAFPMSNFPQIMSLFQWCRYIQEYPGRYQGKICECLGKIHAKQYLQYMCSTMAQCKQLSLFSCCASAAAVHVKRIIYYKTENDSNLKYSHFCLVLYILMLIKCMTQLSARNLTLRIYEWI